MKYALAAMTLIITTVFGYAAVAQNPHKFTVEAGPIWDNEDAKYKCPSVCARALATWEGQWWTTEWERMSVCECVRYPAGTH